MTAAWQYIDDVVRWLDDSNSGSDPAMGLVKISEELGEVAQAYSGSLGRNPRKGVTHARDDVAAELCDVILAAMVSLHDFTDQPAEFFEKRVGAGVERLKGLTS
ncbi:MazG-like family protein [Streptomyces sp. OK228]|uniref:MazG-like family protein n=1 Tax=Streptomyces sp. OK228 TaxID=1882786 RepID=UPI000BD89006|nr:MazG-like family protein [Streptomyces sp. OK228]SOE25658.1 hypothetical protein SAMN05442782_2401 [Streptomyces sp. OK228]